MNCVKNRTKWIVAATVAGILAAAAALFFYFYLPYYHAESAMPADAVLSLEEQADGNFRLSWPMVERADYYRVEVTSPGDKEELLYQTDVKAGVSCVLRDLPKQTVTVRVNTVVAYDPDDPEKIRLGEVPAEVTVKLEPPAITDLEWTADDMTDTVSIRYGKQTNDDCRIYVKTGEGTYKMMKTIGTNETKLTFGEGGDLPVPEHGEQVILGFDACRESGNLEFSGYISQEISLIREDFLGRDLTLTLEEVKTNVVKLQWSETKGEIYRVQMKLASDADWTILTDVAADGERSFTTHHLPVCQDVTFRVIALGGQTMPDSDFAAVSEEIIYKTQESAIYATVWPTGNLKTYADPQLTEAVGKVKAAAAYCVLDEVEGAFAIGVDGKVVYIDSNHCLINLPEYLGDLCTFNITNSYSSLYMVHEYEIPDVTDVVTGGYEKVKMADGSYLVPLLYPTAKKVAAAAKTALEQGVRLKIYDAYRPNKATVEIYDRTESILDDKLPKKTFKGETMNDLPKLPKKKNEDDPDPVMTYGIVMTNNSSWELNSFLAKGASTHNYGIAVDITLETLDGEELKMQTSIHELSWYSVLSRNNDNAKLLASIMKSAGMGELVSEWWHFQDNDIRQQVQLNCVWAGVTPECWMKDDFGWKYRRANGTYFADGTFDIYGVSYSFDSDGYIVS